MVRFDLVWDRYWLLTWSTYGTWLPGDERGFVSNVRDGPGPEVRHNAPGTPYDADQPQLRQAARSALKGGPILLTAPQSEAVLPQFRETASYRQWGLLAAAVMANHTHLVVGVPGDPEPEVLLRDFKSYASRVLNRRWGKPASGTWWTESGSKRKKTGEAEVLGAVEYVRDQPSALAVWVDPAVQPFLGEASGGRQPPDAIAWPAGLRLPSGADAPRSRQMVCGPTLPSGG